MFRKIAAAAETSDQIILRQITGWEHLMDTIRTDPAARNTVCVLAILIVLVLTALATIIIRTIITKRIQDDLENDEPLKRTAHSEKMPEKAMFLRQTFWVCQECGQEFRLLSEGAIPEKCPYCGETGYDDINPTEDEIYAKIYTCPACGQMTQMLDGDEMEHCPYCGKDFDE